MSHLTERDFFKSIEQKKAYSEGVPYQTVLNRRWGSSIILDANTRIHKLIDEPSVQFHRLRTEEYILYSGKMAVYRGNFYERDLEKTISNLKEILMFPGDKLIIPPNRVHVPVSLSKKGCVLFEISHGVYDEGDITRIYDKQGNYPKLIKKWNKLGYGPGLSIIDLKKLILSNLPKKSIWESNLPRPKGYENCKLPFVVHKPWGWERWLELWEDPLTGRGYCMKHLFIRKDKRLSYQFHKDKVETNFLIKGEVEAYLSNDKEKMEKRIMSSANPNANTWTVPAGRRHRTIALTDVLLAETSTTEVDDVIRLQDDTGRGDGKIESEHFKLKR